MALCPECRDFIDPSCQLCCGNGVYSDDTDFEDDEEPYFNCDVCGGDGHTMEGRVCPVCGGTGRQQ